MRKKKGFTLVELLAVIVILAVILVIAVPQIMSVIESARKGSIESTAKLIASSAEREYTNRKILGKDTNIECSEVANLNDKDYGSCSISFDNSGKATVTITGKGKFEGYTCKGNSNNIECTKSNVSEPTETDAQYFSYSRSGDINEVTIKDKDKCVAYLLNLFNDTSDEAKEAINTYCSGGAVSGLTLKDAVQQGVIPSSDYETAGLEVTYEISITGYNVEGGLDVVIPSEIDGKKVIAIADYAFTTDGVAPTNINNTEKGATVVPLAEANPIGLGITSVVIPNTVLSIGDYAFKDNKITSAIIPNSVTSIGAFAFENNQLTEVTIPSSVTILANYVFCNNQLKEITIPSSVTYIGAYAFYGNQLTSVVIPNKVTGIDAYAFQSNQLTKIVIPNSVTSIGLAAFDNNNIVEATISNNIQTIESYVFRNNQLKEIIIPDSVTSIDREAFANNQLTKITFPSTPITIYSDVFKNNPITADENYTYPDNVTINN